MKGINEGTECTRLIPVSKWSQYHVWPPIGGLRHLIFYAENNGFCQVIRRVGRRILIDEQSFFKWVEQKNIGVSAENMRNYHE